jgi:predicted nucleotidyltransferase
LKFDPATYADGLRKLNEIECKQIEERIVVAKAEAVRLATAIKAADRQVHAIYLFGSLARSEPTRLDFDIDLAMDGGDVYLAMDIVADSAFDVDVVDLNRLPQHVREGILQRGVKIQS